MSKSFSHEQLLMALFDAQDLMERARIDFFLDGDTLFQATNGSSLEGDTITIGIKRSSLTQIGKEVLLTVKPEMIFTDSLISYIFAGIQIHIKIHNDSDIELQNPDLFVFCYETFCVPNPVNTFLQKNI